MAKKKGLLQEFKDFAVKGNLIDLAIGIVIGAAFGKIVSSFVADVLMPPIGLLMGGVDFGDLSVKLGEASLNYGVFVQTVIDFLIIAFAVFLVVRMVNKATRKMEEEKEAESPSEEVKLLQEIRDLLKK